MLFWKKNKHDHQQNLLRQLEDSLVQHTDTKFQAINELISKMARVQYKSFQDMQSRLEHLESGIRSIEDMQQASRRDAELREQQSQKQTEQLFRWLDDMDALRAQMVDQQGQAWDKLLEQWTAQLIGVLAISDIHEIHVLGTSFDPAVAESIGTEQQWLGKERPPLPYEVVKVIQRGYMSGRGKLLRKAQVITLQGEFER